VSSPLLFFMLPPPPLSPLFPYTTLFRSLDLDLLFRTDDLPRIRAAKPVVGLLVLPTVLDGLPEHPVLVPEPIPHRRELHRGHRRSEEHTSELQSPDHLVCRLLLEKKNKI